MKRFPPGWSERATMILHRGLLVGLAAATAAAGDLAAQSPSSRADTTQAPGAHYRAGGLHRFLLGSEYRSLWSTPVSVPVLDLRTYGGGLRPVSKGGGKQTKSLLLVGNDGRQFFFRAIDKDASVLLPPELRGTVAGRVVRDQTSSALPSAPPMVASLLAAAGIPHAKEHLFVLPRDSNLGEFQDEFGGLMGFLQERVGGADGPPSHWGGATEIIGSDTLLARVGRSSDDRVDARAFLAARLFDVLIGDWDRHRDQWVWIRLGQDKPRRWIPVPRDRDQAFAKYDGFLFHFARQTAPQLTNFGPDYPYMPGATWNGRDLDRRFLVELDWPVWDSVATALKSRLTDSAIANALRALPPQHYRLRGAHLAAALRSRRDRLSEAAGKYYRVLAEKVDVHGTDQADNATLIRLPKGELELTLSPAGRSDQAYFTRRFHADHTQEVRLFLGGGDDRAVVRGEGGGIRARILAEEGQDLLVDSVPGGRETFYDDPAGRNRTEGFGAKVDRRPYTSPYPPNAVPPRDWGQRWALQPSAAFGPDMGALLGVTATHTGYGFRKFPFATRHRVRAGFATGPKTYRVEYLGEFRRENSANYSELLLRASGIDVINFHGFGNEIAAPNDKEFYRVTQDAFGVEPSLVFSLGSRTTLRVGPILKYVSTDERPGRFLATLGDVYGTGTFGEIGGGLGFRFDSRDRPNAATRGVLLQLQGKLYPPVWDVDSTFGELQGLATTYLSPRMPLDPTLAFRIGGRKLWGAFPYFEAAFIGDASTVRLGRVNRFAGDAAVYGSAELRLALGRLQIVLPADVGVFGLADAGRVFLEAESSDEWHTALGGGLWLAFLNRAHTLSLAAASSEERTGIYVQAGFGF
jgi:Omp85 superfamily domain